MPRRVLLFQLGLIFSILLSLTSRSGIEFAAASSTSTQPDSSATLQAIRNQAYQHVLKQDYEGAISQYRSARVQAQAEKNNPLATQFLINLAGCYQSISAYRAAMQHYQLAIEEAKKAGLKQLESVAVFNVASLLLEMGEDQSAADLLKPYPLDGSTIPRDGRLAAFIQQMNIFTRLKNPAEARAAFERALAAANEDPSPEVIAASGARHQKWPEAIRELRRAWAFGAYAQALTKMEKHQEAEAYALEAFRLRSTYQDKSRLRDALQLAILARFRADYQSAAQLLQVARDLDPTNRMPMHLFLLEREQARIELARGQFATALPSLRNALNQARAWRMEVLPSSSSFLNFESNMIQEVQEAFLKTISQQEFKLEQKGVAAESFWIAEEARFASMRAAQFPASEFSKRLPNDYWSLLTKFQRLQMRKLNDSGSEIGELMKVRRELSVMEMEAGLRIPQSALDGITGIGPWLKSLPPDEVVFSFYLSEPYSLAWTATRKGISVRRIAGQKQLARCIQKFRLEITNPSQNGSSSTGMEISRQLFGEYLEDIRTIPFWTMVLDQELASLPIAALPAPGSADRYLVEDHNLRTLPSAIFLQQEAGQVWQRTAVGMGDSVYNPADLRSGPIRNANSEWLQLNRLPASAGELDESLQVMSDRMWTTVVRTGLDATPTDLRRTLAKSPDILHLSAHFVSRPETPHQISIALSPDVAKRGTSLFSSLELNAVRTQTKLVVLSGCDSSTGEIVAGIGINGLSRAFLISGASTVIATLWPTIDTNGPLFPKFYGRLIQQPWSPRAAAESLRAAQIQMIRRGGWTAKPAYWAAYLAISKG